MATGTLAELCYRPSRLIDAIWQRFAEEIAGIITCSKCPAPKCGRWFLRSAGRGDRKYCCHACQMRVWRAERLGTITPRV